MPLWTMKSARHTGPLGLSPARVVVSESVSFGVVGDADLAAAIRVHDPQLVVIRPGVTGKDDLGSIRRPAGLNVRSRDGGDAVLIAAVCIHYEDVVLSTIPIAGECDLRSIRRPGRVD